MGSFIFLSLLSLSWVLNGRNTLTDGLFTLQCFAIFLLREFKVSPLIPTAGDWLCVEESGGLQVDFFFLPAALHLWSMNTQADEWGSLP